MKVVILLVVAIYASWAMLMFAPANCQDLTFDVTTATQATYYRFITDMRNTLRDPTGRAYFGLPMLPPPPKKTPTFLFVVLKFEEKSKQYSIRLGIEKENLYLRSYADNQLRARFLSDFPKDIDKNTLFGRGSTVIKLSFNSQYSSLEGAAKVKRTALPLSLNKLKSKIKKVCDRVNSDKTFEDEAQFMLLAIQMVSEAARFRSIETSIGEGFPEDANDFMPNAEMIALVKEWGKMSKTIAAAKKQADVQDLIKKMGLLNYVPPSSIQSTMQLVTENVTASIGFKGRLGWMTS